LIHLSFDQTDSRMQGGMIIATSRWSNTNHTSSIEDNCLTPAQGELAPPASRRRFQIVRRVKSSPVVATGISRVASEGEEIDGIVARIYLAAVSIETPRHRLKWQSLGG
jgi:hypothetical protein